MTAINLEQAINLVIHEFGHAIDDLAPQFGVIGKQLNEYGTILYESDIGTQLYMSQPIERANRLLGDIVSGAGNYGKNPGFRNLKSFSKELSERI